MADPRELFYGNEGPRKASGQGAGGGVSVGRLHGKGAQRVGRCPLACASRVCCAGAVIICIAVPDTGSGVGGFSSVCKFKIRLGKWVLNCCRVHFQTKVGSILNQQSHAVHECSDSRGSGSVLLAVSLLNLIF